MNLSKSLIAVAIAAVLPLAAVAGEKDKMSSTTETSSRAQFAQLDTNRDGRLSQAEASADTTIMFSTADKNGDGYLDGSEYTHREMGDDSMKKPADPATDTSVKPKQ